MAMAMMHGWMMMIWLLAAVVVAAAVVAAAVVAIRHWGAGARSRQAVEVLEERYAMGEIDEKEYHQRRRVLHR